MSELTPRQVRALILLLVLVPLIPTTLMLRLMINSVRAEQLAGEERTHALYQQALRAAGASLAAHVAAGGYSAGELPQRVLQFYEQAFDRDVAVRVVDARGKTLAGDGTAISAPLAEAGVDQPGGWRVQLLETGGKARPDGLADQIAIYSWAAAIAVAANLGIAGLAGYALNQQMRLQELKSSSLATVSHELRTPLASMRLLLDTLASSPAKLSEYLPLLAKENTRLAQIAENFLTVSQLERGHYRFMREPVTVSELFDAALEALRFRLEKIQPRLTRGPTNELPMILVDKGAMVIALVNLIDNALKYSSGPDDISLAARSREGRVILEVADKGRGISKSQQKRIFSRFYQVDQKLSRAGEGCGLGLSIVKSVVEAQGGTIRVESAESRGSTFYIELPAISA
ncbi:MAG: two-component system, OmpR family, phosphate regulon sensor histidine kinase PhoR [Chthoniobacter sp.]|jgi:signal transduction histidine kinase|nr:two-component system, OmpR family, phosphate regulon sensor histidine kinase PhoR [Chthoniobacter sp.]